MYTMYFYIFGFTALALLWYFCSNDDTSQDMQRLENKINGLTNQVIHTNARISGAINKCKHRYKRDKSCNYTDNM